MKTVGNSARKVNGSASRALPAVGRPDGILPRLALIDHPRLDDLKQRLQRVEILYGLSDVIAGVSDLKTALRRLNRVLGPELGMQVKSVAISNPQIREAVGGLAPSHDEMETIGSWQSLLNRSKTLDTQVTGNDLLVPLIHQCRVQGILKVKLVSGSLPEEERLPALIGTLCAEVIHKAVLRRKLEENERQVAIFAERERIARDLHDSVGRLLYDIGFLLNQYAKEAPDAIWRKRLGDLRDQAVKGGLEIRQAIHGLLFLQARRRGLDNSLRDLSRKFQASTGIDVRFKTTGKPVPLLPAQEDALFRVAYEALVNSERHARASLVLMVLTYEDREVHLKVSDDGVGLAHRNAFGRGGHHFGLRGIQRMVTDIGGNLYIRNASPHGVLVEARVDKDK